MIMKLRQWWQEVQSSFWFVPAVIVMGAVGLAIALIAVDTSVELHVDKKWPLIFGSGAAGARGLLTSVASSMITVAGVVFSITIVALSLTSSQYTSRILRNFMRDRLNQAVLGVFVGIFAYCLVVLRTIRGGDEGPFVPSLAVLGGLVLAFVGIGFLIFFIHHISMSIQASSIIAAAAEETISAVDHLFPNRLGDTPDGDSNDTSETDLAELAWSGVRAHRTGYIESIDEEALLGWARNRDAIVRMERGIGEFVVEGDALASVADLELSDEDGAAEVHDVYVISHQRSVHQDVGFGIRQIVDIAMKALSPGVNDTTTAVMCLDYLTAIFARLADRGFATTQRFDEGKLRVIARVANFESLLAEAFNQIRQNAEGNVAILTKQLQSLESIVGQTTNPLRRNALLQQVVMLATVVEDTIILPHDSVDVKAAVMRLSKILNTPNRQPYGQDILPARAEII